ncbi:hypothetical protein [Bifidobacterium tibiigranuli]|jgi:hypothetical protein|uniref:Transposase n=1 Tax=Bifidobacterium tibiigranuli TaxID=2172043 RepID=A0A5N6S5I9_9BIFI|nr:hypothetical protein [Bifidobacterium tibiigranuli]KAE8129601.1 hypothetical protein DDE84_01995 [Bifidobacterium tibiigranuli]KAE8129966.1 hypothetical protein DDF78_02620 [Bifidobacterium tibiigranuli]MCI1253983.1 hypothetical protein [Bifidobacterium tibiigranuli]
MTESFRSVGISVEEKREHVLAYLSAPRGGKGAYLEEHRITRDQMSSWKSALADGDLGAGLVPRHTGSMTKRDVAEIRRLQRELERTTADLERMRTAADCLGKAIDVLREHGVASDKDESR